MFMIVRKASPDDAGKIYPLLLMAMRDIVYLFIGEESDEKAQSFMEKMVSQSNNQYSWENCWVMVVDDEIVAAACVYNGTNLQQLRMPVVNQLKLLFDRDFIPEDETGVGEFYIDSVGVNPNYQGKGYGSELFKFLISEYVNKRKLVLGLLVDKDNPGAKKLYLRLGFKLVGEKVLAGKAMEHLQCSAC
jgi:ribosomal protein S18 acetylase RimI-like enzyme